jgi:hypothetical protein
MFIQGDSCDSLQPEKKKIYVPDTVETAPKYVLYGILVIIQDFLNAYSTFLQNHIFINMTFLQNLIFQLCTFLPYLIVVFPHFLVSVSIYF